MTGSECERTAIDFSSACLRLKDEQPCDFFPAFVRLTVRFFADGIRFVSRIFSRPPLRRASVGQIARLRRGKCHGQKIPKEAEGCRKPTACRPGFQRLSTRPISSRLKGVEGRGTGGVFCAKVAQNSRKFPGGGMAF
jgi:hypothetical protein